MDQDPATIESSQAQGSLTQFYKSMQWKREHRPDRDRFVRSYKHSMCLPDGTATTLTIKQSKFSKGITGFASTVWDSSIVVAKHIEKHHERYSGRRCLDLSAGCGLVGIVLATIRAQVTATDLTHNLPLLQDNCQTNVPGHVDVVEHVWGEDVSHLMPPFDYIFACDVMYVDEAVHDLVASLRSLTSLASTVLVAHGRNRFAEGAFLQACAGTFSMEHVAGHELDPVYQCADVDVLRLRRLV